MYVISLKKQLAVFDTETRKAAAEALYRIFLENASTILNILHNLKNVFLDFLVILW